MERKEKKRIAMRQNRALKSAEEKRKVKEKDKIKKATMRNNMTEEEKMIRKEQDKKRKAEKRKLKKKLEKDKESNERSKDDEEERREKMKEREERKEKLEEREQLIEKMEEEEIDWDSLMFPKVKEEDREERDESEEDEEEENEESYFGKLRRINKESQKKKRGQRSDVEIEFDRIDLLIRMREKRNKRDGKKHLLDNLASKKSMRELGEIGPLIDFANRDKSVRKRSEIEIWSIFWNRSKECSKFLEKKKPAIVEILKENKRKKEEEEKDKEEERKRKEEAHKKAIKDAMNEGRIGTGPWEGYAWVDGNWFWAGDPDEDPEKPKGEWVYQADIDDYHWVGEGPPPSQDLTDDTNNWEVTEEDKKRWKEQEEKWLEMELKEQKLKQSAYMKEYRDRQKQKLNEPIEIPDYGEKSPYLLLQEKNIKERKEWMKASGLFD